MNKVEFSKVLKIAMKYYSYNYPYQSNGDPFMCNAILIALNNGHITKAEHKQALTMVGNLLAPHCRLHILLEKTMNVGRFQLKAKNFMDFWKPHIIEDYDIDVGEKARAPSVTFE